MKLPVLLCSACATIALAGSLPAAALAAEASASLTPLTFILVDLDLADGVTPSITFNGTSGSATAPFAASYLTIGNDTEETVFPTGTDPAPISHAVERNTAALATSARFDLAGRASPTGAALSAAVGTQVLVAEPGLRAISRLMGDTGDTAFTLSANTGVLFSLQYDVALDTAPPPGAAERLEAGSAAVWMHVIGLGDAYDEVRWLNHVPDGEGFLELAVWNETAFGQGGTFSYGTELQVESITPVPEPAMLPLLGTGLALLAGLAGRRSGVYDALSRFARRRRASFGSAISGR